MQAEVVDTGEGALERLRGSDRRFDLVVLDVMLPGKDGFEVVSELRAERQFVPVLMLTARGRPEDVLKGFAAGADDYLPKPTELAILLARIGGLLRRSRGFGAAHDQYSFAGKTIDFDSLELRVGDRTLAAHADGSEPAAVSDRARRQGGVAQGDARRRVGRARGHRHARDRQLHRAAAPAHREGAGPAEAPADGQERRLQVRRESVGSITENAELTMQSSAPSAFSIDPSASAHVRRGAAGGAARREGRRGPSRRMRRARDRAARPAARASARRRRDDRRESRAR